MRGRKPKAPLAKAESTTDEEEIIAPKKTLHTNKKIDKTSKKTRNVVDEGEIEEEEEECEVPISKNTKSKSNKKIPEDEVEAVAIIYEIHLEKHPFYHLNGVPDSIEVSKLDCTKEEVSYFMC